jgi:membrane dipeptidase
VLKAIADGKMRLGERVEVPLEEGWAPPPGLPVDPMVHLYNFTPHTSYFETMGFYDVPRFLEGGLTAQAMAIYLADGELSHALHRTMEMVAWLYREAEEHEAFEVVTTVEEIRRVKAAGKTAGFLTFEGFEPLEGDVKLLDAFAHLGLRMASLTHSRRNPFADGIGQLGNPLTGGLTDLGRRAVRRMNELSIVVDLAHLNIRGCWEVLALSEAPVVLSHCGTRRYFAPREETPGEPGVRPAAELLEAIAANGGVIGIIAYSQPDLTAFVDDVAFVIERVGPDHVGLGTDFFGFQRAPRGFQGMQDLPAVTAELVARGYDDATILKVLGGNYLRVFEAVWR